MYKKVWYLNTGWEYSKPTIPIKTYNDDTDPETVTGHLDSPKLICNLILLTFGIFSKSILCKVCISWWYFKFLLVLLLYFPFPHNNRVWIEEVQAEHLATSQTCLVKPHLHSWCSLHILLKQELEVKETPPRLRQSLLLKSFYPCLVFLPVVNWTLQFAEQVVWMLISHWDKMTTQVHLFVPERARSKNILFYLAAKKGNICCLRVPTFEFGSHNYRVMFIKLFQR